MQARWALVIVCATLPTMGVDSCDTDTTSTPVPTETVSVSLPTAAPTRAPTVTQTPAPTRAPTVTQTPAPTQAQATVDSRYPLTQQQALALLNSGVAVASWIPRSRTEVLITPSTEPDPFAPSTKRECTQEYDSFEGGYVEKCRDVPVVPAPQRPVYIVSGALSTRQRNAVGAIAQATAIGAVRWRRG
jgi:hypothetical protein